MKKLSMLSAVLIFCFVVACGDDDDSGENYHHPPNQNQIHENQNNQDPPNQTNQNNQDPPNQTNQNNQEPPNQTNQNNQEPPNQTNQNNQEPSPPPATCEAPIEPVEVDEADHIVGDGAPESCTEELLAAAIAEGGTIAFDCGEDDVVIDITEALELRTDVDTTIVGDGKITLDGGRQEGRINRIFYYHSPDHRATDTLVTLQGLTLQNAEAPAEDFTEQDSDNPECAWGYKDGAGGALRMRDGRLHVIDSVFRHNRAAEFGPDTGGGAIYAVGAMEVVTVGSTFVDNQGSNGGAIGLLQSDGLFYNTEIIDNRATGEGQNFGGATGCPDFNHGEQGGAGGNGGAIAIDGSNVEDVEFCGVVLRDNHANELATLFRTPNTHRGETTMRRVHFDSNHAGDGGGALWMQDMELSIYDSAITNNSSDGLGAGVRVGQGPHGSTLHIENTTFYNNVANESLGGGLVFSGEGMLRNVTFAENEAAGGEGYFGAAIVAHGSESSDFHVHNTIFWNNIDDHQYTPMTCSVGSPGEPTTLPGSNNFQWPETRHGSSDIEDNPCTSDIVFADAELGGLGDNGGPTPTMMPATDSVVIGAGEDCPEIDQRGEERPEQGCTAGAVELP